MISAFFVYGSMWSLKEAGFLVVFVVDLVCVCTSFLLSFAEILINFAKMEIDVRWRTFIFLTEHFQYSGWSSGLCFRLL
jgi:hypothetical protein